MHGMFSRSRRIAQLVSKQDHVLPGQLLVSELSFKVPLNHANPADDETITLFGRSVVKHEKPIVAPSAQEGTAAAQKPYLVYLQGGPGFGNPAPQDHFLTRMALSKGYQALYLDYRGVGLSSPVTARSVTSRGDPAAQAAHLRLFRQDSIVADLEAVRECLTAGWPQEKRKWSIFGQSFGGFVALTYLSFRPEGLREAFLTGGLAPVGKRPEEVYATTFRALIRRNEAYYEKFPKDVVAVRRVVSHIMSQDGQRVQLPSGGILTVPRFLTIGISLGKHGGLDIVHDLVLRLNRDLDEFGYFSRPSLSAVEGSSRFDDAIIYAILHEAIYCFAPGVAGNWAAQRVGEALQPFGWLLRRDVPLALPAEDQPVYFSGEMIYPFHFETHPELVALREAAELLAQHDQWPALYDETQLRRNDVPVYAASYIHDMYVDLGLARDTVDMVKGIKVWETNMHMHNAISARTDAVVAALLNLRDDTLD